MIAKCYIRLYIPIHAQSLGIYNSTKHQIDPVIVQHGNIPSFSQLLNIIQTVKQCLVGGIPTPLKNMKVSWEHSSQHMESHKIHVPNHQPVVITH